MITEAGPFSITARTPWSIDLERRAGVERQVAHPGRERQQRFEGLELATGGRRADEAVRVGLQIEKYAARSGLPAKRRKTATSSLEARMVCGCSRRSRRR